MPPNSKRYLVPRNTLVSVKWMLFAVGCFGFAAVPWTAIINKRQLPEIMVLVFMVVWSAIPIAMGVFLLGWARYRIELWGVPGHIFVRESWLLRKAEAEYIIDRAYLVRQWHYSKYGNVIREVVYVRCAAGKQRLADELTCRDLPGLSRWIADVTRVKLIDIRHRSPVGT